MSIIGISNRKGTASILGTLIFVSIIFTSYIPMMLVMKQADILYDTRKQDLQVLDEERGEEALFVYVQTLDNPPSIIVKVQNKGVLGVKIVRLWINNEWVDMEYVVPPMSDVEEIYTYPVAVEDGSYSIVITTDTGQSVAFEAFLYFDMEMGWEGDILLINVLINSLYGNMFRVVVTGTSYNEEALTLLYEPKFFNVPSEGDYTVTIFRGSKEIYSEQVTLTASSCVYWVFA